MSDCLSFKRRTAHWFAFFTAVVTFVLLASGGLVTSHGVGMAVPDWPTTFGYNMFLFPVSRWIGGVFYEHTHRLIASAVGLLTVILTVWLLLVEPRRWVKLLAVWLSVGVVVQGVLGGLRVALINAQIGIFHGMLAQSFFVGMAILVIVTAPGFIRGKWFSGAGAADLRSMALGTTACIFIQLTIAAMMRHAHAGLSIPDFPLAYGSVLPSTDPATLAAINVARVARGEMPTTAFLIWLQMAHRFAAILIAVLAGMLVWRAFHIPSVPRAVSWACAGWMATILVQIGLGAWTIWSNKAADIATTHMALGALTLVGGSIITFRCFCSLHAVHPIPLPESPRLHSGHTAASS